ncbi:uncharacterized protein LOC142181000 [Nicotiana tabacum]|uniref:Uncharacterized protein LOC142181000 n=1 Tax=Nicotiana tabacum TaxID=4097 RepID=A0AC58UI93_TOBAC
MEIKGIDNFSLWYRFMKIALLGQNKLGMVDGRWKKEKFQEKYWYQWERCNAIVLSWLMNVVALTLISGIAYATNAHTMWIDLQERFDKILMMKLVPSVNQAYAMLMSEESQTKCSRISHSKENCYKIVGYPADYKFKKKGGAGAYNAVAEYGSTSSNYSALPELSPYSQPS